jgi:hypothetical protein
MGRMQHEYHRRMAGDTPDALLTLGILTDVHFGPEARWNG